jgi:hypothetical protein
VSIYADQFDVLVTTTLDKVRPTLSDQISNENVLLAWLNMKARITVDGGTVIRRPLLFAFNDTVGSYSGYDLIDVTPQEGLGWVEYPWRQHAGSVTISGEEVKKNSGSAQLINLLQAKMDQLKLSIADDFNAMLFASGNGNGGKDFIGLMGIIAGGATAKQYGSSDSGAGAPTGADTTDTHLGGINASTYSWWKSNIGTGLDLTSFDGVDALNNLYNSIRIDRSKVDLELTTQANYEAYEALAVPNIRFQNLKAADLGFETIAHKTAEVVFDPDVPTSGAWHDGEDTVSGGGAWFMLNSDRIEFVQHSDSWLTPTEFVRPYNQDAKTALVLSMGNLITDSRRAHGAFWSSTV